MSLSSTTPLCSLAAFAQNPEQICSQICCVSLKLRSRLSSRLRNSTPIAVSLYRPRSRVFPRNQPFAVEAQLLHIRRQNPLFSKIVNFLVREEFPPNYTIAQRDKIKSEAKYYVWDNQYLWKHCAVKVIRRCLPDNEVQSVLNFFHSYACGGHSGPDKTARKVLHTGFFWLHMFRDAYTFVKLVIGVKGLGKFTEGMRFHKHR